MRAKSRQKAVRTLFASIVSSDLSVAELRDLAFELQGGILSHELGSALAMFVDQLMRTEMPSDTGRDIDSDVEAVLQVMKRRRLSKSRLAQMMSSLEPTSSLPRIQDVTAEEYIREFFLRASSAERHHLLSLLDAPSVDDPYLDGIMKRLR